MSKKELNQKTIYYQFEGVNEIFSAPEWEIESRILATKHKLGIGIWTTHKIIKDYAPINPVPPTPALSSSVSHSDESVVVPKRVRKAKAKSQTNELSTMPILVEQSDPLDLVPDILRDYFAVGLSNAIPDSDKLGSDSQETK
jgi:hypothetical protein